MIAPAGSNKVPKALSRGVTVDQQHFVTQVRESLHVSTHLQLMLWLQGDFQRSLPHRIFIAAWGDFSRGMVKHDVVSAIPALRTHHIADDDIGHFTGHMFQRWIDHGAAPFGASYETLTLGPGSAVRAGLEDFSAMRSALVHGIRDARGRHDCIYIFLNSDPLVPPQALDHLSMMLPFIDAAVRKVEHLPSQNFGDAAPQEAEAVAAPDSIPASEFQLSSRELEIMGWVRMGKTNHEVGRILNISTYTVKNHLQRIFRKLNVTNRAQAVADPSILDSHREGADRAGLLRDLPQSYRA